MKVSSHGVHFERTGECKRCGACEKLDCPHLSLKDGLTFCDTYGKGDYLLKRCYIFPDTPFCGAVLSGACAYTFIPLHKEDELKYRELLETWQLG